MVNNRLICRVYFTILFFALGQSDTLTLVIICRCLTKAKVAELGRLKGEYDAPEIAAIEKSCSVQSKVIKPEPVPKSETTPAHSNPDRLGNLVSGLGQ